MSITGQRLKALRKKLGLSADDVASALSVSRSTIFRYENGAIEKVPAYVLEILAKILHTTPAYLMGWTDNPDIEQISNEDRTAYTDIVNNASSSNVAENEQVYYINDETRKIAQEIYENPELRSLFHAARDISPERLKAQIDYLKFLKTQEKGNNDEGC